MFPILFMLAVDPTPHLPPLWDAGRFPTQQECAEQKRRWEEHREWLKEMGAAWTERREDFARWDSQCERAGHLWEALQAAAGGYSDVFWMLPADEGQRQCLNLYREMVGAEAYRAGWTPMRLPAGLHEKPKAAGQ
jgi:hypothetical protein